jgi:SAM-dependent methyltransferase
LPAVADFISLPFYDLFAEDGHVPKIRESLSPLLTGVRRSILEIGAGTGLITTSLAEWTPAEIFALEPSAGMRAILLSRLSSRPELLDRVTVLPCDALSVTLDEPAEAVVMINVMYALEPDYRKRLWPVLAASLETAGLLVFTWRDGGPPAPRPNRRPLPGVAVLRPPRQRLPEPRPPAIVPIPPTSGHGHTARVIARRAGPTNPDKCQLTLKAAPPACG